MIKIAVLGYGTVGSGVVEVIQTNQKVINERVGEELDIKSDHLSTPPKNSKVK